MALVQKMFHILYGHFTGYAICLSCGALLKNYLPFHNCLLYCNIEELNIKTCQSIAFCIFPSCNKTNNSILSYLNHMFDDHKTLLLYKCDLCGIAFVSKVGVYHHMEMTSYKCYALLNN